MKYHLHKYNIESSKDNFHIHRISGYSERMIGIESLHLHMISGVSSYIDHTHNFYCRSGFPIKTKNGHIHKIEGILEQKNGQRGDARQRKREG